MRVSDFRFGNFVSASRIRAGLTQTQLAHLCGVSKNTISSIENEKTCPSVRLALLISYFLDCPFDRVFYLHWVG